MQNFVPLGTGNSRLMKSNIPAGTTWEQAIAMLNSGTFPYDTGQLNAAGISVEGTPLNKQTLLQDSTAQQFGLTGDATVDQVLQILKNAAVVNSAGDALETVLGSKLLTIPGVQIATGSYVGTGTYGSSNPNSLTFDFAPSFVLIYFYSYSTSSGTIGYSAFLPFSKKLTNIPTYQYGTFLSHSYVGYTLTGQYWSNNFKTLTWYGASAASQANLTNYTYHYIAIE